MKSEIYIFSLLMNEGAVNGAMGLDIAKGEVITFHAKIVLLATGGHSRMFQRSSSHFWENNGDGIALAHSVGARFMDMEMFQFHPTGMVYPEEAAGLLVTEATRGEGGILTNNNGERFMEKYDKERMELSARDVVARAIWKEIEEGRGTKNGGVYLDISHKSKEYIVERIPDIYEKLMHWSNTDISKEKMEVAPTAHYSMGGVQVDHTTGATGIAHLHAVGELTSGIHGGNRLGGNSLAEVMVFGKLTGQSIANVVGAQHAAPLQKNQMQEKSEWLENLLNEEGDDPIQTKKDIQEIMWEGVGVIRDATAMNDALQKIEGLHAVETPDPPSPHTLTTKRSKQPWMGRASLRTGKSLKQNENLIAALDIQNMIPTCEMIIRSALMREESRAAHARSDFPKTKEQWRVNIVCTPSEEGLQLAKNPVPSIPEEIREHLKDRKPIDVHLLE